MLLLTVGSISAQKAERDFIRRGNRAFRDSSWVNANVNYRKALEINPGSPIAMYNLGNALLRENKAKDAMEQYVTASKIEKDKTKLAQIYHNMGVLFQAGKDYGQAVDAYKQALRNNPADEETRYNLALAQKLLKQQQQQNQDQQKEQEQKEQEKKNQPQQQNQQQQQQQNQQQENQLSKENAEQLLQSAMQDEKEVQDKVQKQQMIMKGSKLEKDW
ncbi:MAG: tetratricopeptide repeat protein [Prevotellaceae bacterium]|nr:tetratricopeptide repeat protein [Prevotellaceae bacterium]